MGVSMNFNARDLEKAVMAEAAKGLKTETTKAQRQLDAVSKQYAGKPAATVEPQVRRALRGTVFDTKDGIAMFTKAISQGDRPVLKLKV